MKTYKEYLKSTSFVSHSEEAIIQRKPVYRASAVFPVIESYDLHTKILFMGYWLIKRSINELGFLISLRNQDGTLILRQNKRITSSRAHEIEINDLLMYVGIDYETFVGSIELEVFSNIDLVYPYPAFVVNYFNSFGSGLVHTTGRVFNDIEDLKINESIKVKEAGFDLIPGKDYDPFFAFVNGHQNYKNNTITIELINKNNLKLVKEINLGLVSPLQTMFVKLKDHINVDDFLGDEIGTIKIKHDLTGFFPRFISGNFCKTNNAVAITHSYYDNSENNQEDHYFFNEHPELLLDSSIFVPVFANDNWYTQVKLYPIYSPSNHSINLKFFDQNGNEKGELRDYIIVKDNVSNYVTIDIINCIDLLELDRVIIKGVQIYKVWEEKSKIPTRLKYGLNIGQRGKRHDLPTNICFNSAIANINVLKKKGTFKWMPLVNQGNSLAVIHNSSFCIDYNNEANVKVSIHHTTSDNTINRTYIIPPNAQIRIDIDDEIEEFLGTKSGWVTIKSDNPFVNCWYFEFNDTGIMGGDHSF